MKQVQQHPDGWIFVRTDNGVYMDTPENFARDFGVEFPPLPEGGMDRIYISGELHAIHGARGILAGGPMPWDFGDDLIARVDEGLAAQRMRKAAKDSDAPKVVGPVGFVKP